MRNHLKKRLATLEANAASRTAFAGSNTQSSFDILFGTGAEHSHAETSQALSRRPRFQMSDMYSALDSFLKEQAEQGVEGNELMQLLLSDRKHEHRSL